MIDEQKLKEKLTSEQYRIMRQKGKEAPFTGKYWNSEEEGNYHCAACGNELFSSEEKLTTENGWPEFAEPIDEDHLEIKNGEIACSECGSHLGFVIGEGEEKHYRLNSAGLDLHEEEEDEDEDEEDKENGGQEKSVGRKLKSLVKNVGVFVGGSVVGAGAIGAAIFLTQPSFMCKLPALNNPPAESSSAQTVPLAPSQSPKTSPPASGILKNQVNPVEAAPSATTTTGEASSSDLMAVTESPVGESLPETQTNPFPPGPSAAPDVPQPDPSGFPKDDASSKDGTP